MRIKIIQPIAAAPDGLHIKLYHVGEEYDVVLNVRDTDKEINEDFALSFIEQGQAEELKPKSAQVVEEKQPEKIEPPAPPKIRKGVGPSETKEK